MITKEIKKEIESALKVFMKEKNISIEELARQSGLNQDYLTGLEGQDLFPSLGPLLKISRALGVRLGTLLDDQISPDPLIVR